MKILLIALFLGVTSFAHSGLATSSSRVIFEKDENQKSFILANINEYPIIVQSWVDEGEGNSNYLNSPFVVTPPVFKMQQDQNQSIRIIYKGNELPQDRESVYWLNLYEIPGKAANKKNKYEPDRAYLNLAMNTQLKIFYRPQKLKKMDLDEILSKISFSFKRVDGKTYLECGNTSPYNVSFSKLKIITAGEEILVEQMMDMMARPLSRRIYLLPENAQVANPIRVDFEVIKDNGQLASGNFKFR